MASCCHQLRTVSLLEIKNAVSAAFGEEGLEALIGSASAAIEKTELFLIDLFAHEAAIPLVMRVSRGFVAGGAVLSLLPRPRAYAMELVLELSMCFATVRSAGLSLRAQIVCSPLVQAVGNAFREGIRDFGDLNGVAADQVRLPLIAELIHLFPATERNESHDFHIPSHPPKKNQNTKPHSVCLRSNSSSKLCATFKTSMTTTRTTK